ncbi:MAG: recombinase RecT [bacterium]|nr:recombinase RecT [bacterium]
MAEVTALTPFEAGDMAQTRSYLDARIDEIRASVAEGATPAQLEQFLHLCALYGLDPFRGEIYWARELRRPFTSRDGYRKIARRNPRFRGCRSGVVYPEDEFEIEQSYVDGELVISQFRHRPNLIQRSRPIGAWAIAKVDGEPDDFAWAPMSQYAKDSRGPWQSHPDAMIRKCAESVVLRAACDISGLYTGEELGVSDGGEPMTVVDVTPAAVETDGAPPEEPREAAPSEGAQRRRAFAIASKIRPDLDDNGVDEGALWDYVRKSHGVESRRDLTEMQWKAIADELDACTNDGGHPTLRKVEAFAERIRGQDTDDAPPETAADTPTGFITTEEMIEMMSVAESFDDEAREALQAGLRARYQANKVAVLKRMADVLGVGISEAAFYARLTGGDKRLGTQALEVLVRLCVDQTMWDDGNMAEINGIWRELDPAQATG